MLAERALVVSPTELFVYGTLRHDQPEHAKYCRGVTGWKPARLRAQRWMLPQRYLLAVVPADALLLLASLDLVVDEVRRLQLSVAALAAASQAGESPAFPWVVGEVLFFRDAVEAWPSLDRWEEFMPGGSGAYARAVVPAEVDGEVYPVWAYVATSAPPGSILISG
jgi:gamma-glutamylcyclotransferase (GGCT)/AIG2-like uncharacterized protein YtfP